jgi:hypothetical protein
MPTFARGDYVKVEFQDETTVIAIDRMRRSIPDHGWR